MLEIKDIVTKLPSTGSNGYRSLRSIRGLVVHHDGVNTGVVYKPVDRYIGQARYHIRKGWNRLAYHLRIACDGTIFLTNRFEEITWHAGHFQTNLTHIAVCLDGDLSKMEPSDPQKMALKELIVYLTHDRPDMPHLVMGTVNTHREVRPIPTTCPGDALQRYVEALRAPTCAPLL